MRENKHIKNLSIGWVVEAVVDKCYLTPGYNVVRKIVYADYEEIGTDIFNKYDNLPIIYPVVDFSDKEKITDLENGEYVIVPCTSIDSYLEAFNICVTNKLNRFKKRRIKNLIFENGCAVNEPLFIRKSVDIEKYNMEVKQLQDFKLVHRANTPTLAEHEYLENISSYQKSL